MFATLGYLWPDVQNQLLTIWQSQWAGILFFGHSILECPRQAKVLLSLLHKDYQKWSRFHNLQNELIRHFPNTTTILNIQYNSS